MPSPTSPRRSRPRPVPSALLPPLDRQAVLAADAPKPMDIRTDARQTRTREYMLAENDREAALVKKGYWF
jgi:hypothetical protein